MKMQKPVYFDYCATTPLDPRVLDVMLPFFTEKFGNSSSSLHSYGWEAEAAADDARQRIASALNCKPQEIIFTSGATESNNWVFSGLTDLLRKQNPTEPIHIISSQVEHNSVLKSLEHLSKFRNIEVDFIAPQKDGTVSLGSIQERVKPYTKILSFMWVNNELGSTNPVEEIAAFAKENKIYFHTDATQAVGKIEINLDKTPIDLLSFSAHKIYGPKGAGILYLRGHEPKVQIEPLLHGGGHERGLRSGTLNVPAIVGMGKAVELVSRELSHDQTHFQKLRSHFLEVLNSNQIEFSLNGSTQSYVQSVLNISFKVKNLEVIQLPGFAFSKGSACQSGGHSMSHVLKHIGLSSKEAENTFRFSFGRFTTLQEVQLLAEACVKAVSSINLDPRA